MTTTIRTYNHYADFYWNVRANGREVQSRYGPTVELLSQQFECTAGDLLPRVHLNYSLGFMELLQLVSGIYDEQQIKAVAPKARHSLFTEKMAYGPRLCFQIPRAIDRLSSDPGTRQAVLFVGNEFDAMSADLPCTETIQFLQRDGDLHTVVSMRSWDLAKGMPYDIIMFGGLAMLVARCLELHPGRLIVTAGSTHIYKDEFHLYPKDGRVADFGFNDAVPRLWGGIVEWAKKQVASAPWINSIPYGMKMEER